MKPAQSNPLVDADARHRAETAPARVVRFTGEAREDADDELAREEPLEIRLRHARRVESAKAITVTMRTPGHDEELARGFLISEGIVKRAEDITAIQRDDAECERPRENTITVVLAAHVPPPSLSLERNFFATSSCGVCGKASIAALLAIVPPRAPDDDFTVPWRTLVTLPNALRAAQASFARTGGLHATALFDAQGTLVVAREDVGRHNAFDKAVGERSAVGALPLSRHIALVSGRASFELVQKALMAGISILCAVGAPSSLAVDLARDMGMTLVGFLRGERCNVYAGESRVTTRAL